MSWLSWLFSRRTRPLDDVIVVKNILRKTLNAEEFLRQASRRGFSVSRFDNTLLEGPSSNIVMMTGAARDGFIDTLVIQLEGSDRKRTLVSSGELTSGKGRSAGAADPIPDQNVANLESIDQLQAILNEVDRPLPNGVPDKTCRAVGERLHALGGVELMQTALANFAAQHRRGNIAAAELSRCWDRIGAKKDGSVVIGKAWVD